VGFGGCRAISESATATDHRSGVLWVRGLRGIHLTPLPLRFTGGPTVWITIGFRYRHGLQAEASNSPLPHRLPRDMLRSPVHRCLHGCHIHQRSAHPCCGSYHSNRCLRTWRSTPSIEIDKPRPRPCHDHIRGILVRADCGMKGCSFERHNVVASTEPIHSIPPSAIFCLRESAGMSTTAR